MQMLMHTFVASTRAGHAFATQILEPLVYTWTPATPLYMHLQRLFCVIALGDAQRCKEQSG